MISRLSESTGIPFDMLTGLPMIKMTANREMIIEDAGELERYDGDCVMVMQGKICLKVCGSNLRIRFLANNSICVFGYIKQICFDSGGKA